MISKADFLTINEKRKELGYEPIDSPVADQLLVDGGKIPLDDVGLEPEMPDEEGGFGGKPKPAAKKEEAEEVTMEPAARDEKGRITKIKFSKSSLRVLERDDSGNVKVGK